MYLEWLDKGAYRPLATFEGLLRGRQRERRKGDGNGTGSPKWKILAKSLKKLRLLNHH